LNYSRTEYYSVVLNISVEELGDVTSNSLVSIEIVEQYDCPVSY